MFTTNIEYTKVINGTPTPKTIAAPAGVHELSTQQLKKIEDLKNKNYSFFDYRYRTLEALFNSPVKFGMLPAETLTYLIEDDSPLAWGFKL